MLLSGKICIWNDERGFGFIAPDGGSDKVFVHISAFRPTGRRPEIGETVRYGLGHGKDGRPRATRANWVAESARRRDVVRTGGRSIIASWFRLAVVAAALAVAGIYALRNFEEYRKRQSLAMTPASATMAREIDASRHALKARCDGRTMCSQMTSCEEATWFINHCPGTKMDGNKDGVPCEQQWCN